jgi:hypothetical protein
MNKFLLNSVLVTFLFCGGSLLSQNFRYVSYIFPSDSLRGFDEVSANQDALNRGFFGKEYKIFMYRAKRDFINKKYGYYVPSLTTAFNKNNSVMNAPCINEDFEASPTTVSTNSVGAVGTSLAGWTISTGNNISSCTMAGCCSSSGSYMAWVRATPYTTLAPLNLIPNSPLGGTNVIQMNDNIPGTSMVRIEQTFTVTTSNSLFEYAIMAALNGSGHACCDQPFVNVRFFDCSSNLISCATNSLVGPGSACTATVSSNWTINTSGVSYTSAWDVYSVDLSPYIGSCITVQVTVSDCDGGAHEGWAFFDARCSSSSILINSVATTSLSTCSPTATLTAPGAGPFSWNGPGGSGITSNTNAVITTSTSGNYSLTIGTGSCAATQTVSLTLSGPGSVSITPSALTICLGQSVTLTANGTVTSYTWSTGSNTQSVSVSPTSSTNYSVTGTDTSGCNYIASQIINVSLCTGVEQLNADDPSISIFPNPNNGTFTIQSKKEESITITNELGQMIQIVSLNAKNNYKFTVGNLSPGVYFMIGERSKQKIVVQK